MFDEPIWNSAIKFGKKISQDPDYIPPEIYNSTCSLKPRDYSDASQAELIVREYQEKLRFTTATKFIVYNGSFWEESEEDAYGLSSELTDRQLTEAEQEINKLADELKRTGAITGSEIGSLGKRALQKLDSEQVKCYQLYKEAIEYRKFITKHRSDKSILLFAMKNLNACGYKIVAHVHDEVIIEADEGDSVEEICEIMAQTPEWAKGLLLKAEGYDCMSYRKM